MKRMVMKHIVMSLIGCLIVALACGPAGAWSHSDAYGSASGGGLLERQHQPWRLGLWRRGLVERQRLPWWFGLRRRGSWSGTGYRGGTASGGGSWSATGAYGTTAYHTTAYHTTAYHTSATGTTAYYGGTYATYHPPTTVHYYGSSCYNCGGWSTAGAAAAGAAVGMAAGAAVASANTAAATSSAYSAGYAAGATTTAYAMGAIYATLPAGCVVSTVHGTTYYHYQHDVVPAVLRRERRLLPRGAHALRRLMQTPLVHPTSGKPRNSGHRRGAA